MKKLLGVAVLLALVAALVPVHAFAALRGVWDPLTNGGPYQTGLSNGCEQPALRPGIVSANGGHNSVERWFAFTTRSTVFQRETSRSIWQGRNSSQIGNAVVNILDARHPLLFDPTGEISYTDPAWSPNGKYLAYVQTDFALSQTAIYIQEFTRGTTVAGASTPVGSPLLVVAAAPGVLNRSPDWKPDGTAICYSSTAAGPSLDIWYVSVDPVTATVGAPARATSVDSKSEVNPSWGPGNRIVYATNKFGRNALEIVDLDDMSVIAAQTNFALVSHNNPSWSSDGNKIFYDAPQNEDGNNNTDIFVLDLPNQSVCDVFFDNRGDADPDVSAIGLTSVDGLPYNLFLMSSTAANNFFGGINIWRGNALNCAPPLALGVSFSPTTLNLGSNGQNLSVTFTLPAELEAAGYVANFDIPSHGSGIPAGKEGIKNRLNIIPSPTLLGLTAKVDDVNGVGLSSNATNSCQMDWPRKTIEARLVALGLVNQQVPCAVTAYSNLRGRQFQGFGYLRIATTSLAGQAVRMEQNAPNPFNPVTTIKFSVAKPGFVNVRVFNVRGELVKTVARGNYGTGAYEATWDGTNAAGSTVGNGVYFAKASVSDGNGPEVVSDVIKMVMAK